MIGYIKNTSKEKIVDLEKRVLAWFKKNDLNILEVTENISSEIFDLIIVLGGDGTILNTVKFLMGNPSPIMGINGGNLGFLTAMEKDNLEIYLEKSIRGEFEIEERMLIEINKIDASDKVSYTDIALNEVAVSRKDLARVLTIEVEISGNLIGDLISDGVIIATPTGSTAYSLSAGGPILTPKMEAFVITPICPHTLSKRPMVVSSSEVIKVLIKENTNNNFVTADGQRRFTLSKGEKVEIKMSEFKVNLVRFLDPEHEFFSVLEGKLGRS